LMSHMLVEVQATFFLAQLRLADRYELLINHGCGSFPPKPCRKPRTPFKDVGRVYIELEPSLLANWRTNGGRASGLRAEGDRFLLMDSLASFDKISLPAGTRSRVTLTFASTRDTPAGDYVLEVVQVRRPASA